MAIAPPHYITFVYKGSQPKNKNVSDNKLQSATKVHTPYFNITILAFENTVPFHFITFSSTRKWNVTQRLLAVLVFQKRAKMLKKYKNLGVSI